MSHHIYLTIDGVRRRLIDIADEKGMPRELLRQRHNRGFTGNKLFAPAHKTYRGDGSYKFPLSGLTPRR